MISDQSRKIAGPVRSSIFTDVLPRWLFLASDESHGSTSMLAANSDCESHPSQARLRLLQ